ncbi:hypothetical protein [Streptomyces sp. NPDC046870]
MTAPRSREHAGYTPVAAVHRAVRTAVFRRAVGDFPHSTDRVPVCGHNG